MKFTLEEVETNKIPKKKKKPKKDPKYTDLPKEDIPYAHREFTKFIDSSYDDQDYEPQ